MKLWLACVLVFLVACSHETPSNDTDGPPVSHADLRGLFERLDELSGNGYRCDNTFAQTRRFLAERKLRIDEMIVWLGGHGAGCDCEVVFNVQQQWGERVGFVPKK